VVLAAFACACGRLAFDPSFVQHRKLVTIDPGASALMDFPVGVIVAADAELALDARVDGRDLAFMATDGTLLDFEIESYDGSSGALVAWVRMPVLAGVTTAYLEYGGGRALDLANPTQVWPGCRGVWHFAGPDARDSTAQGHDFAVPAGMTAPSATSGIAGTAIAFDGASQLAIADPVDGSLDMGTRSFSLSLWVAQAHVIGMYDMPLFKGGSSTLTPGYDIEIGASVWRFDVGDGMRNTFPMFAGGPTFTGRWTHLVGVADRANQLALAYVNGAQVDSTTIAGLGSVDSALPLEMSPTLNRYAGAVDELRLYDHLLAPAWIAAEYANLSDPGSFASVGAEVR
jgi:MSHA biogenesis protein MshQ